MNRVVIAIALSACSTVIDVDPVGDYTAWKRIDTYGTAPGHGDSYRIIYANDVASRRDGQYAIGAILIKEVRDNVDNQPGALRVIELMRRTGPATGSVEDQGGWLFTAASTPGGAEVEKTTCWRRCHVQAPFAGAWMDYRR